VCEINTLWEKTLRLGERMDDIGFGGMKLIQKPDEFCYGVDAVILSEFASSQHKNQPEIVVDLGTGTGIIPLIMYHKICPQKIYGIEVQCDSWERACRNAINNGLEKSISFINDDIKNVDKTWGRELKGCVDMVISNPPYFKGGGGIINDHMPKTIARHETSAGIEDFIECAAYLLKPRGEFFMIHRPSRLVDICYFGRKNSLEPKLMRFVSPKRETAPNLVLIEMVKNGGSELRLLDPMWIYDGKGQYTQDVLKAYK
jgi:tRNA1Val (adenine37-N6)-methyltransferase